MCAGAGMPVLDRVLFPLNLCNGMCVYGYFAPDRRSGGYKPAESPRVCLFPRVACRQASKYARERGPVRRLLAAKQPCRTECACTASATCKLTPVDAGQAGGARIFGRGRTSGWPATGAAHGGSPMRTPDRNRSTLSGPLQRGGPAHGRAAPRLCRPAACARPPPRPGV